MRTHDERQYGYGGARGARGEAGMWLRIFYKRWKNSGLWSPGHKEGARAQAAAAAPAAGLLIDDSMMPLTT